MSKIIEKKYYIEFCIENKNKNKNNYSNYVMQSKVFDTKKEAIDWYTNDFDFVDGDCIQVWLMVMEYYSEDGYDIDIVKQLNK